MKADLEIRGVFLFATHSFPLANGDFVGQAAASRDPHGARWELAAAEGATAELAEVLAQRRALESLRRTAPGST